MESDYELIQCLPPLIQSDSSILILGTMPATIALKTGEYYSSPGNLFWDIIYRSLLPEWKCDEVVSTKYADRIALINKNKIAIWDTIQSCERKRGSLDSSMKNIVLNRMDLFFLNHQNINCLIFNGPEAFKLFRKQFSQILDNIKHYQLPSTSARSPMNSFKVFSLWKKTLNQ